MTIGGRVASTAALGAPHGSEDSNTTGTACFVPVMKFIIVDQWLSHGCASTVELRKTSELKAVDNIDSGLSHDFMIYETTSHAYKESISRG